MKKRPKLAQSGFTLIELLIAVAITAMLGIGANALLNQGIRTDEAMTARVAQLTKLQRANMLLSRDLGQVVRRSVRGPYGDIEPALSSRNSLYKIELTRTGWRNPAELIQAINDSDELPVRSELQRVAYVVEEEKLIRYYWPVLDRSQDSEPVKQEVIDDVRSFSIRFLDGEGSWSGEWPSSSTSGDEDESPNQLALKLPKAVEISLEHGLFGEIKRIFGLAGSTIPKPGNSNSGRGNSNTGSGSGPDDDGGEIE